MDKFASSGNGFVFPALNAELRYVFENSTTFLPPPTLTLASPCQIPLPPFLESKCNASYKRRRKYIDLGLKFQLVLIQ